jgi:RNA polymerase sigma factor (sigma-70 family)
MPTIQAWAGPVGEAGRMSDDTTVFVVDDDPQSRESLRYLLESVGLRVQTFASSQEFLDSYEDDSAGCLVLDMRMPGMSGLELMERLAEIGVELPVIVVTAYGDIPTAVRAMKGKAVDFMEKPVVQQRLLEQVQKAIASDLKNREVRSDRKQITERYERLTPREREVMWLVVDGQSSKQIASELGVSFKTIEAHRAKIMKKMQVRSVPYLIRMSLHLVKD